MSEGDARGRRAEELRPGRQPERRGTVRVIRRLNLLSVGAALGAITLVLCASRAVVAGGAAWQLALSAVAFATVAFSSVAGTLLYRRLRLGEAHVREQIAAAERHRARDEAERAILQKRLDSIRQQMNDVLLLMGPDGAIQQTNPRALQTYGYAEEEMLRLNVRDLRAPASLSEVGAQLERVRAEGVFRFTTVHRRKDGSTFPVEVSSRRLDLGEQWVVESVVRDLTEERAAHAALAYQAMVLDNLHDAVIGFDLQRRVNSWNRAAEELFGWTWADALGRPVEEVAPTSYEGGASMDEILRRLDEGTPFSLELRRRTRWGAWIEVESTAVALRDLGGAIVGYVSVNRDLTARRRAEAALRESGEKLQRILETSNDGIWIFDASGRTEFLNRRGGEIFGLDPERTRGRAVLDCFEGALREEARAGLKAIARGETFQRELKVPRPDGTFLWVVLSSSILRDGGGRIAGAVSVFMDVTAHRWAEQELQQAQKLEAVGRLAAGIAHEINTPIQYIGDNTHFLQDAFTALTSLLQRHRAALAEGSSAAQREELERLAEELDVDYSVDEGPKALARTLEGVRRVASIVRAMKEFAHPDQKEMVASDLNRALTATVEVARNEYKYVADVKLDLSDLPPVTCHAGDLNQVFLNLVVNAAHAIADVVKGTSQRGTIGVSSRREGDAVVVAISDTGCGIPEAIRDKVFEPFFTTKEVGRGTGQGLTIARSVVAKHNGQITFTTQPGRGTTFFVRIPIAPAAAKTQAPVAPSKLAECAAAELATAKAATAAAERT